jgi:hypothetical protein
MLADQLLAVERPENVTAGLAGLHGYMAFWSAIPPSFFFSLPELKTNKKNGVPLQHHHAPS